MDENVIESLSFFEFLKSTVTLDHPARSAEGVPSLSTGDVHLLICMTANFELFTRNIGMIA